MATHSNAGLGLSEVAKRHDPNGNMAVIADVLAEENGILQDAIWMEANDTFSNKSSRWSSEPSGSWRKLNRGVSREKALTTEVRDTIGLLDTISKNDIEIIHAFSMPKEARNNEVSRFVTGLGKTMASSMIYANTTTDPEKFTGLAPRMDSLATTTNVLNEGGSGSDLTSIFVVDWDPNKVFMAYPKNSKVGLEHDNMGKQLVQDSSSNDYRAYVDYFSWKAGMVVKNDTSIGRIANIETTGTSNTFDEDNLITLLNRMTKGPKRRIYVNETIMTQMEIRLKDKSNVNLTKIDGLAPGLHMMFKGVPIRQVDQIVDTESTLS